jgi:hypothetical protein
MKNIIIMHDYNGGAFTQQLSWESFLFRISLRDGGLVSQEMWHVKKSHAKSRRAKRDM